MADPVKWITGRIRRRCGDLADLSLERCESTPWQSLLFDGGRHHIDLRLDGDRIDEAVSALCDEVAASEFVIPGHVLAEIRVTGVYRDTGHAVVRLDALTVQT